MIGNVLIVAGCLVAIYGVRDYVTPGMVATALIIGMIAVGVVAHIRDSRGAK